MIPDTPRTPGRCAGEPEEIGENRTGVTEDDKDVCTRVVDRDVDGIRETRDPGGPTGSQGESRGSEK